MTRGSAIQGGSDADTFEQVVGDKADAKPSGMSQRDQGMAVLGEDQGIDLCVGEIVEQMASVIGVCGNGDGGSQEAVIVGDGGGQALDTLPEAADGHGLNSSRAVCTCSAVT